MTANFVVNRLNGQQAVFAMTPPVREWELSRKLYTDLHINLQITDIMLVQNLKRLKHTLGPTASLPNAMQLMILDFVRLCILVLVLGHGRCSGPICAVMKSTPHSR